MKHEFSSSEQDPEQQLRCLRELAASLESARSAVLHSNLAELTRQTVRQRELCAALGRIDCEILAAVNDRWRNLVGESRQMVLHVSHLNREYGALLARARRTVEIFCRVLANSEATYPPPKRETASSLPSLEG